MYRIVEQDKCAEKNQRKIVNIFLPIILANVVGAQVDRLIKWCIAVGPMMPQY